MERTLMPSAHFLIPDIYSSHLHWLAHRSGSQLDMEAGLKAALL